MIEALCNVLGIQVFFALAVDFLFLKQCFPTAAVSCVRICARVCCFSFVHCAGRVHGLSNLATNCFML